MTAPRRRETRRPHLDAATVPVERALITRAEALKTEADGHEHPGGDTWYFTSRLAAEFRALADELHYWG